jgi:hypothetical protein
MHSMNSKTSIYDKQLTECVLAWPGDVFAPDRALYRQCALRRRWRSHHHQPSNPAIYGINWFAQKNVDGRTYLVRFQLELAYRCNQILTYQLTSMPARKGIELEQIVLEIPLRVVIQRRINERYTKGGVGATFFSGPTIPDN